MRDIPLRGLPGELDGLTIMHISDVHAGYGPGLVAAAPLRRMGAPSSSPISSRSPATSSRAAAPSRASPRPPPASSPPRATAPSRCSATTISAHGHDPFAQGWDAGDLGGLTLLDGAAAECSLNGRRVSIAGASIERTLHERDYDPAAHLDVSADLRILLCHFPDAFPRLRSGWAHLVLAGHLHGGQICIPWPGGRIGLAHPRSGPISALEASNGTVMHVSPGIGTTFVPLRLFAQPEVTLLRLRSA